MSNKNPKPSSAVLNLILMVTVHLLCMGCGRNNENREMDRYLEAEIADRIHVIKTLPDSAGEASRVARVGEQVNRVILLSKDIENLQAAVHLGNKLFTDLAAEHNMNLAGFLMLDGSMHIDDMASTLKQNELSFLNQYIFRHSKTRLPLYTAH